MRKRTRFYLGALLCLLVLVPLGVSLAVTAQDNGTTTAVLDPSLAPIDSAHFALHWNTVAAGGGTLSSANFQLSSTVGQTSIGDTESTHFEHRAGFWQKILTRVFLPLITNN